MAGIGIRGTTFIEIDNSGRISYLREICEPLFKPGDQTVELLKAIGSSEVSFGALPESNKRTPKGASDLCSYLWRDMQGRASLDETLSFFADSVLYEDFNYEEPMRGKAEVSEFLKKFAEIKSLRFVPERFSDGEQACCFTWHVEIAGVPETAPKIRGLSFYELDTDGKIAFVRDIPESVIKPPPLQAAAAFLRPQLRTFTPRPAALLQGGKASSEPCNCAESGGIVWPTGEFVEGDAVLAQVVTGADGRARPLSSEVGSASGVVVVYLRHLG